MDKLKLPVSAALVAAAGAFLLVGCGASEPRKESFEEPFGFVEIRELTAPVSAIRDGADARAIAHLERNSARISELYGEALTRFESIYGDGVGPARGTSAFLDCKSTFRRVAGLIDELPIVESEPGISATWAALRHCHEVAGEWSGPAEMATFGNDLDAMTGGSMLVFGYATAVSDIPAGATYYREAAALTPPE